MNFKSISLLVLATCSIAVARDFPPIGGFGVYFKRACESYIEALRSIDSAERYGYRDFAGRIFLLRLAAIHFQDLKFRHDEETRYSMDPKLRTIENSVIQDWLGKVIKRLQDIASFEERRALHGWEVLSPYNVRSEIVEFRNDLALILSYPFAVENEMAYSLKYVIDAYLNRPRYELPANVEEDCAKVCEQIQSNEMR